MPIKIFVLVQGHRHRQQLSKFQGKGSRRFHHEPRIFPEFYKFCKPYFDKKTTWSFTPLWRNVYFSEDGKTAWFEEQLTTWMEECRGSGVLVKKDKEWKLVHYNLTVLIENEKVKSFIELRKE